jgi:hypothetical protein
MADGTITEPYYERMVFDDEHPEGRIGHVCGTCLTPVDMVPCPEHAPREVHGLTLVACAAEPRHWLWVHAGDYYDPPCYRCELGAMLQRELEREACRHWGWRRWRITGWAASVLYGLRLTAGHAHVFGNGHHGCLQGVLWRWRRRSA